MNSRQVDDEAVQEDLDSTISNDVIRQLLERSTWGQPGIPGLSPRASSMITELAGRYSSDLTLQAIKVAKQKNSESRE
jgi:hypothetical protein